MNQKKTIEGRIEEALDSLDGIRRASPQPWFYARVKARLDREEKTVWESISFFLSKPAVVMAGLAAILMLNVFVLSRQSQELGSVANQQGLVTDSESIIASNSSFDYENLVQP